MVFEDGDLLDLSLPLDDPDVSVLPFAAFERFLEWPFSWNASPLRS